MVANALVCLFLPKPDEVSYSEAMRRLRVWLDCRKIQPSGFERAPNGFELAFQGERDAATFDMGFASSQSIG